MQLDGTVTDTVSPMLAKVMAGVAHPRKILNAIGTSFATAAQDAFDDPAMRPAPWAPKKAFKKTRGGKLKTKLLVDSGMLRRSPRVTKADDTSVTVGTSRTYAAYHQLGAPRAGIPARPFFPVDAAGAVIPKAAERLRQAGEAALQATLDAASG